MIFIYEVKIGTVWTMYKCIEFVLVFILKTAFIIAITYHGMAYNLETLNCGNYFLLSQSLSLVEHKKEPADVKKENKCLKLK